MKQIILIIAVLCISATTIVNNITVIPAKPKNIVCFSGSRCYTSEMEEKIKSYSSQGYIVKHLSGSDCKFIVIMEKY